VEARNLLPPTSTGFLLVLHFDLEHGGDMFVRNVGLSPIVTAVRTSNPAPVIIISDCLNLPKPVEGKEGVGKVKEGRETNCQDLRVPGQ
jgi:hypothetical protein